MDIASDDLFNILQVKPSEDLEDIHGGNFGVVCRLYYRSTKATLATQYIPRLIKGERVDKTRQ